MLLLKRKRETRCSSGTTLVEVIFVCVVVTLLFGTVYRFLLFANQRSRIATSEQVVLDQINVFTPNITREVRNAKFLYCDPSGKWIEMEAENGGKRTKIRYEWHDLLKMGAGDETQYRNVVEKTRYEHVEGDWRETSSSIVLQGVVGPGSAGNPKIFTLNSGKQIIIQLSVQYSVGRETKVKSFSLSITRRNPSAQWQEGSE